MRALACSRDVTLLVIVAAVCGGCGGCASVGRVGAEAGSGGGTGSTTSMPDGSTGGAPMVGACGPVGPWGDWPPADAGPREPEVWPPAFQRPDCGSGCRLITTRWGSSNDYAYEMRFSGSLLAHGGVALANLATLDEYRSPVPEPEANVVSYTAALSRDCLVQEFHYEDAAARRGYLCESCLHVQATRGLWFGQGVPGNPNWAGVMTANETFVLLGGGADEQGNGLGYWALDLRDGSKHTFATSSWLLVNVSLADPYIVLSEGDEEVHLIDTRDWSDTNVTADPALQWMAASDGKTIVWIDQRFHPGGDTEHPANQEVVAYDIESKQMRRLTYTDDSKPSAKWDPAVEGDWVVWQDDRDSSAPNTTTDTYKDRVDIYGFNLQTGKQYHVLGNSAGTLPDAAHSPNGLMPSRPRLYQGRLYVLGLWPRPGSTQFFGTQVWEIELPVP
jgi:hypothetical protein